MQQQEIELRFLHDQHIKNMLSLEKERTLLDKQNPNKLFFSNQKQNKKIDHSKLPILRPDSVIEKLLYYPPAQVQAQVASRKVNAILSHWDKQCRYIPEDIQLKFMREYGKKQNFDPYLTPSGRNQVQDIIAYAKNHNELHPSQSLKQKYSQSYTASILKNMTQGGPLPTEAEKQ